MDFIEGEKRLAAELEDELLWLVTQLVDGVISRGEYELAKRDLLISAA